MKMVKYAALLAAGLLASTSANASTVFDSGPVDGQSSANTISNGFAVSASFTLASNTIVNGFTFAGWNFPGELTTSINYGISTAPTASTTGTSILTGGMSFFNNIGYDVTTYTGAVAPITLTAGTYYLTLADASTTGGLPTYWDRNFNQVSQATQYLNGDYFQNIPGVTFSILGDAAGGAVPEPATWAMMIGGMGVVGGALRRRRSISTKVSFA